ncbi:MAG: hypothetical protein H6Q71_2311, partial [Firmicutes bacterium]|nr:hypothetical protein [Bacillota bacterium]
KVPNFKPLCGKICEQVLANVLGKARTKPASNNTPAFDGKSEQVP